MDSSLHSFDDNFCAELVCSKHALAHSFGYRAVNEREREGEGDCCTICRRVCERVQEHRWGEGSRFLTRVSSVVEASNTASQKIRATS